MLSRVLPSTVLISLVAGCAFSQYLGPRGTVVFPDGTRVGVEIADTPELRQRGLMFRERLAANEGMVFIFEEPGFYPFWMKNTLIPLDIIWLDDRLQVVHIAPSVPPCKADPCPSYPHQGRALYVVEVVSGFARQHNLRLGDALVFEGIPRKAR